MIINYKNLNYLHNNKYFDYFELTKRNASSKRVFFLQLLIVLKNIFFSVLSFFSIIHIFKIINKDVFYVGTLNQYNSIISVKNNLPNSILISTRVNNEFIKSKNNIIVINNFISFLFSLLLTPIFIKEFLTSNKNERNKALFFFSEYYVSLGNYYYWNFIFKFIKPKSLIFANELKSEYRSIILAARNNNITTNYISHGVTLDFNQSLIPICKNYFLSGEYEKNHYSIKDETNFHLVGRPVYDNIKKNQRPKQINTIGICTNSLTDEKKLLDLITSLKSNYNIIYRPHPGHNVFKEKKFTDLHGVQYSNSNLITPDVFFQDVDLVITGNSSIIIEVLISGIYCVIFQFDKSTSDPQNFIKNKICSSFSNLKDLVSSLKNKNISEGNLNYYVIDQNESSTNLIVNKLSK
jgi:hypothetical protein